MKKRYFYAMLLCVSCLSLSSCVMYKKTMKVEYIDNEKIELEKDKVRGIKIGTINVSDKNFDLNHELSGTSKNYIFDIKTEKKYKTIYLKVWKYEDNKWKDFDLCNVFGTDIDDAIINLDVAANASYFSVRPERDFITGNSDGFNFDDENSISLSLEGETDIENLIDIPIFAGFKNATKSDGSDITNDDLKNFKDIKCDEGIVFTFNIDEKF